MLFLGNAVVPPQCKQYSRALLSQCLPDRTPVVAVVRLSLEESEAALRNTVGGAGLGVRVPAVLGGPRHMSWAHLVSRVFWSLW